MLHLFGDFASGPNGPVSILRSDVMLPFIYCDNMPTALVAIYTAEGFVLAADGRGNDGNGSIKDSEQKIFSTHGPSWALGYGLSGAASILDDETGVDIFKEECRRIADELKTKNPVDLGSYAELFADVLGERIQKELSKYNKAKGQPAKLCFAGYFNTIPAMAIRQISFNQTGFSVSQRDDKLPPRPSDFYLVGSQKIADLLQNTNTDEFTNYRNPSFKKFAEKGVVSLQEAVEAVKSYIGACSTDKARELDTYCKTVGGHICIATITSADGFNWVEAPVQSTV